eukprot:scaffold55260_cov69-Phaeocystis_antarctica.AAC.2
MQHCTRLRLGHRLVLVLLLVQEPPQRQCHCDREHEATENDDQDDAPDRHAGRRLLEEWIQCDVRGRDVEQPERGFVLKVLAVRGLAPIERRAVRIGNVGDVARSDVDPAGPVVAAGVDHRWRVACIHQRCERGEIRQG